MNVNTPYFLKKIDQTKMFQILKYTLSNLLDSTNLIKLIFAATSGDS